MEGLGSALQGNVLAQVAVSALTEGLRLAGVGSTRQGEAGPGKAAAPAPARPARPLRKGDAAGVLRLLRTDYLRDQYFVTGRFEEAIYDEDCRFEDPTVQFAGRDLYKRNLQLISPFLIDPFIQLKSLRRLPAGTGGPADWQRGGTRSAAPVQLQAEWLLTCYVALPWRPYVSVKGTTTYTLNADSNKIVRHVEAWDVSAWQALLLLLRPSERAVWRRPGS